MRERQLIQAIVDRANHHISTGEPRRLGLRIALGELSELDPASFQTHWRDLTQGTVLEQVHLHIRLIPAEVQCMACFQKYRPDGKQIHCRHCGSFGARILSGEECCLESIETEHG